MACPSLSLKFVTPLINQRAGLLLVQTLLIVFISLHQIVSSQDPTKAPPSPEKNIEITHKIEKGNAILSCHVKDLGRRRIIWSRLSDPYPISVGTSRFHPKRKYWVRNALNTNILTIRSVGLEDSGEYECRVSGPFPLKEILSLNIKSGDKTSTFFLSTNRTVISSPGLTAILPCKVENLNDKMVMWKDARNNLVSLRKRVYNGNKRISVIHGTRPEWHLKIEKLEPEDFGYYTCLVNFDPILTRTVELINDEPATFAPVLIRDTNFKSKLEVLEGETVTLTCNFHSYPPAKVSWYKRYREGTKNKRRSLNAEGNEYTLREVKLEQAGDYICVGSNGKSKEARARSKLIVKAKPTIAPTTVATTTFIPNGPIAPVVYYVSKRVGQRRGHNVDLECFAIGSPRPGVYWKRHGKRLFDDHKYKMTTVSEGRYKMISTLHIRVVSSRDFGSYECVGFNHLGLIAMPIELYEIRN